MGRSRGVIFTTTRMFTESRFGKSAVEECFSQLDAQDQAILAEVEPMGWYPLAPTVRFMKILDQRYGKGDLALCDEIGEFSADWGLSPFHKLMARFAPGDWVVRRGLNLWSRYHDSGTWKIEQPGPKTVMGRLFDFDPHDGAWCRRTGGFLKRAVLLTGAIADELHHPHCIARGDRFCEFSGSWR